MPVPLLPPLLHLNTRSLCEPARAVLCRHCAPVLHSAFPLPSKLPQSVWASKYNDRAYVSTRKVRAHLLPRALSLGCRCRRHAVHRRLSGRGSSGLAG